MAKFIAMQNTTLKGEKVKKHQEVDISADDQKTLDVKLKLKHKVFVKPGEAMPTPEPSEGEEGKEGQDAA